MLKLLVIAWIMFYGPQHLYETEHIICLCFSYTFWLCPPWPLINPRSQGSFCQHFKVILTLHYSNFPYFLSMVGMGTSNSPSSGQWNICLATTTCELSCWWGRCLRSLTDPQLWKHDCFLAWINSHFLLLNQTSICSDVQMLVSPFHRNWFHPQFQWWFILFKSTSTCQTKHFLTIEILVLHTQGKDHIPSEGETFTGY